MLLWWILINHLCLLLAWVSKGWLSESTHVGFHSTHGRSTVAWTHSCSPTSILAHSPSLGTFSAGKLSQQGFISLLRPSLSQRILLHPFMDKKQEWWLSSPWNTMTRSHSPSSVTGPARLRRTWPGNMVPLGTILDTPNLHSCVLKMPPAWNPVNRHYLISRERETPHDFMLHNKITTDAVMLRP